MSKEIYISSTPHETRLAIVENDALTEIYYERENEYTLAGSIYNGKVTRVLPGMQSSFVDIGLERDAFLYITDFMEEAPDSAEFDTTSLGDRSPREARLPRLEGQADPAPRETQPREGQPREGQPRGDRNDRGRGRGRRDRSPSGNRTPQADQPPTSEFSSTEDGTEFEMPRVAPLATSGSELTQVQDLSAGADTSEVGEGAPGADGGRRWRGRRGRRRGRGPVANGAPLDESPQTISAGSEEAEFTVEIDHEPAEDSSSETLSSFQPQADAAPVSSPTSLWASVPSTSEEPSDQQGRPDSTRGDRGRGDRGRGREGNDRSGRGDRSNRFERPARAPRGFAPTRSLYGVDSEPAETEAPVEPIILPGESLSKYRPGGEPAPAAASAASPTPSVEYRVAGWDGGSVLPGESLSRHRRPEGRSEAPQARAELKPATQASFLNLSPSPVLPAAVIQEADGVSVAETPETQPEVALAAHPELVPETETIHEAAPEAAPVVEPTPAAEYEPEEGFASYRVDPIPPSEYRQSAPVEDTPQIEAEPSPTEEQVLESLQDRPDRDPARDAFGNTHFLTPAPIGPEPILSEAIVLDEPVAPFPQPLPDPQQDAFHAAIEPITGTPLPGHDVTMLNPMGEMVSLPQSHELTESTAPQELPEPTAPIHHEAAVVTPEDLQDEHAEEFEEEEEAATQSFAPGTGDLEEEVIDEDEYEVAALHAGYDDEMDDLEEETLEGTADLGTMLREMSIDQITRPSPEEGEEEDFEESEETGTARFDQPDEDSEEYARTAESAGDFSNEFPEPTSTETSGTDTASYNERRGGRRDIRRGGRDRDSARRTGGDSSGRPRNTGGSGDRERGHSGGRSRMSMQSTNLPAISELLKPGQEILVQIAKEPIAKKGARITSHIALPGRFLVFMPTVNHTGVSRKIESDGERRRLKEILLSEKGEAAGGFIVRTAASGATEEELRSDLRFLLNLWADIKNRSESSKSPALIYHDLNLVERILRDQVTDNFSAIWVDTETEYERVLRFLQRFQPALIRRVKLYGKETPLFEQFGITEEINKALRSKVWLKSGGSIVINQTEALVAIDINTGKFVGKTARLEDTIVKTNLDAIPEIVRQIRLRDLGGIIIIDFIDMDDRRNRNKVMAALEEELKSDRAPSKVLQFNDFGLVAITRKRVKQSLERTLSTTCGVCQGTGMVKSPVTVCNDIYIEMRKMYKHLDKGDVMLRVHPEVVKQLKSTGTRWLQEMEEMSGKTILIKSDPSLHPEQFDIH